MISKEMSEVAEEMLRLAYEIPEADRTEAILFLTTYLMHHAGTLLQDGGDKATAKAFGALTRQMETLMQEARAEGYSSRGAPNLKLVKK